jgi:molecular chaperone DnaK
MRGTVNFGIDLGTTNSLIAKFERGTVMVFKNPNGFKETLPSVVGFRTDRTLIGDQARAYAERDAKNVASRFKRKMGTTESIKINALQVNKTPVELSAYVLKELKQFVQTGENVEAVVITIPASFDTVQTNATKEAGLQSGFKQVLLLQEPIAASLAYANASKSEDLRNSQWLVYDLGGGTFDVALVRIVEGDLTVIDHEGDNYLGGSDFDALLLEKIIVPELSRRGRFANILNDLRSESGKYNKLWTILLHRAEEAKIELSTKSSAEIDLSLVRDLVDDDGKPLDSIITVTRSEFENTIKSAVDATADMMKRIITRNSLQPSDLKFVLMVGGATYSPFVRKRIEELMGIPVNTSIDPTNAVVVGAAYFAGTKELTSNQKEPAKAIAQDLRIRCVYSRTSQEIQELFSAKCEGNCDGLTYRIKAQDGSYDSGLKPLAPRIMEDLPLREDAFNFFTFHVFDKANNRVPLDFETLQITQGGYSVAGQLLPEDLSLVKDDLASRDTRLDRIFAKNAVLPTKGKKTVEVGKTIIKDSRDELMIMVVEGPAENHSSANKPIGVLRITGHQVSRDLIKGTEIDLTFEVSESRDVTVSAYLNGTGQSFQQVFAPQQRDVLTKVLTAEIVSLECRLQSELDEAEKLGNTEVCDRLVKLEGEIRNLITEASGLVEDDVTDDKFKLEDRKRKVAQEIYAVTSGKRLKIARAEYADAKESAARLVEDSGDDRERHRLTEVIARESSFINSSNPERIQLATSELQRIRIEILFRTPGFLIEMFKGLAEGRAALNDQLQVKQLIENGKRLIEAENWDELRQVNIRLWDLMPDQERANSDMRFLTGIV